MVKSYLSRSCCNAFSNIQLQSRLPEALPSVLSQPNRSTFAQSLLAMVIRPHKFGAAPIPSVFCVKPSSRRNVEQILPTSSSKSAPSMPVFFTFWSANRAIATVLCPCCRQLPQVEASHPETATLLRQPRKALYTKNAGFGGRECFHPWIHTLPDSHSPQLLDDDVVDMMRHEHDDEIAPGHSSVARKLSN